MKSFFNQYVTMSGSKRRTAYRKTVTDSVLQGRPEPVDGFSEVVQIVRSQGSNLLEVRGADGAEAIAILPTKFRKLVWVKRNDFLIASQSSEGYETAGGGVGRVKFMVEQILYPEQIKHLVAVGKWPAAFALAADTAPESAPPPPSEDDHADSDEVLPAMWQNTNRRRPAADLESSDEDEDDEGSRGEHSGGDGDSQGGGAGGAASSS